MTTRVLPVLVMAHLGAATAISARVSAGEGRVTIRMDSGDGADVTLFADRVELVRLRDALNAALSELDAERAVAAK